MKALIKYQHQGEIKSPFADLRDGRTVTLAVRPSDIRAKRRTPDPRLFITMLPTEEIIIALENGGCEVMSVKELSPMWLWHLGLTRRAAKVLISEIESQL